MLTLTDLTGEMGDGTPQAFVGMLDQLKDADAEHPNVSATNADGICLGAYAGGRLTLESLDDDSVPPQHIDGASPSKTGELVTLLDERGGKAVLAAADWAPGYEA